MKLRLIIRPSAVHTSLRAANVNTQLNSLGLISTTAGQECDLLVDSKSINKLEWQMLSYIFIVDAIFWKRTDTGAIVITPSYSVGPR